MRVCQSLEEKEKIVVNYLFIVHGKKCPKRTWITKKPGDLSSIRIGCMHLSPERILTIIFHQRKQLCV